MTTKQKSLRERVAYLEMAVAVLWKGGCECLEPQWYYAQLISCYRCAACGAVLSSRLWVSLPDEQRIGVSKET